jgi:hypothetical protein
MSWDIVVFNLKRKVSSVEEIDEDILIPISTIKGFRQLLTENLPSIRWDGKCGILEEADIYFEVFADETDESIFTNTIFFLRGGEASIYPIIMLCKKYGWQLFDTSLGEMIDIENPERNGHQKYKEYVSHIINSK